jgi:hypothetical protein
VTRRPPILVVVAAVLGALFAVGAVVAALTANHRPSVPRATTRHHHTPTVAPAGGWQPVAPATTIPPASPVQQQYDQGFAQGFASPANRAMFAAGEQLSLPGPAITGGWPTLAASDTPGGWTRSFVDGLLDIDFAAEHRSALGGWLVAQEAPDLMPGIPRGFADRTLYLSVLDPSAMSQPTPIPSTSQWQADAASGVRWTVSALQVELDPQWQQMVDAGWQPPDLRADVEDVSGTLTATGPTVTTTHQFSMVVQVGSARWHPGYGTVLVSNWKES